MSKGRNSAFAAGLVLFAAAGVSFPFLLAGSGQKVDSSKALSGQALIRGAYTNTGSKDIGLDPDYKPKKTVDAALRRSIPATNPDIKQVQRNLEDIAFKLRIPQRKPWAQMTDDVVRATKIMYDDAKVMAGVPAGQEDKARELAESVKAGLVRINAAIEAKDPDKVSIRTAATLENVAALELIEAPGLVFSVPSQYQGLPRLTGRATVQITFEREGDGQAYVGKEGMGGKRQAEIKIELDGYSAPLTAGNFASNVLSGAYDGSALSIGGETISITSSKLEGKILPMEILPLGEFEPLYKTPLDVQGGELPVLPLSIYGAVAMAHPASDEGDSYAAANEFFLYKFERSSSGLAGLSFEEGMFPVFGYVTEGVELIAQLQSGDKVVKASLISGADRLIIPDGKKT